jgi:hypothetical protein
MSTHHLRGAFNTEGKGSLCISWPNTDVMDAFRNVVRMDGQAVSNGKLSRGYLAAMNESASCAKQIQGVTSGE